MNYEILQWKKLTRFLPLAICVCDSRWDILAANLAAERMFRSMREAMPESSVLDLVLDRARSVVLPELHKHVAAGDSHWELTLPMILSSGLPAAVELSFSRFAFAESDAHATAWQIAFRTADKADDNFNFQLNRNITEQAVDPIFVIGAGGEIIFANPEAERVFGWRQEELIGKSLHHTLHHADPHGKEFPAENCPLLEAQTHGGVVRGIELVFFDRKGRPVPVSCSNSPLFFGKKEVGAVLIIRDISRQKSMERALLEGEERLRLALAAANIGTWDLSLISGAASLDENCRKALGLEREGPSFLTSWLRAIHPEDRPLAKQQIESALSPQGDGNFHLECRTVARNGGGVHYVQAQGQAFFEDQGEYRQATRLIGTIQDVSDRKRGELSLKRANEDLQQFAYAAAHDLQEPLRNVVNLLGLFKRNSTTKLNEDDGHLIDLSMDDARRMHQMVVDLLSFSNIHQNSEDVESISDGNTILKDALSNLSSLIDEAGAKIVSDLLPRVRIRPTHLLQLLQNLLSNSLKYRREAVPPFIQVGVKRRGAEWQFTVADNGIGFDSIYAQKIFGVFKRLHGRAEYPGSGIGLAICSRIVHIYSGRIWAEGQPGQGAIFHFTLPIQSSLM